MNTVFSLYAKMESSLLFYNGSNQASIFDKIIRFFSDGLKNDLYFFFEKSLDNNILKISLHPIENPLIFTHDENNILVEVSSGFIGAGYHAWLLDMLADFEKKYRLKWTEVLGKEDPTGYFKNRDFNLLSKHFVDSLLSISNLFIEQNKKGTSNFMLAFPDDYPVIDKEYFAVTMLGYFGKSWFLDFTNATNNEQKYKYARDFYIWFDKETDDIFWFKTILSMIWLYYPFREIITDEEKNNYAKILYALEIAYKLNQNMDYPFDIWIDIAKYLGDNDIANIIKKRMGDSIISSNIGFCREFGITELAGGFSISMPMSMVRYRDDKAGTIEFFNNKIHSIFQVYSFKNESKDSIMEKVIEHIDKTGDKGIKIEFKHTEFDFEVYERILENDKYLITSITVNENLALIGWFTYSSIYDKNNILSFLEKIIYNKV